jgi:hypothetical protein
MPISQRNYLSLGLATLFAICAALSLYLCFKAGCTGDSKGGSLGDPSLALQIENYAFLSLLIATVSGGAAISFATKLGYRSPYAILFALFAFIGLWLLGIQIETWGVQSCY